MSHMYETLQVGAVGARLELQIMEYDDTTLTDVVVDVSSATTMDIIVKRSDGTTFSRAGSFSTNGSDGKIYITTISSDLTVSGTYLIQGHVVVPGWNGRSSIGQFEVNDNLG